MASRQRGNDPGPTAATVADNVKRVRFARRLTQEGLSERLREIGRPIPPASIGKIEIGLRQVDVDDLMALAVALDVSPLGLLLPRTATGEELVEVTGMNGPAILLWLWSAGRSSWKADTVGMTVRRVYPDDIAEVSLPRWLDLLAVPRPLPTEEQADG